MNAQLKKMNDDGSLLRPFGDTWLRQKMTEFCSHACQGPLSQDSLGISGSVHLNTIGCQLCSEGLVSPDVQKSEFNNQMLTRLETSVELGCYASIPLSIQRLNIVILTIAYIC